MAHVSERKKKKKKKKKSSSSSNHNNIPGSKDELAISNIEQQNPQGCKFEEFRKISNEMEVQYQWLHKYIQNDVKKTMSKEKNKKLLKRIVENQTEIFHNRSGKIGQESGMSKTHKILYQKLREIKREKERNDKDKIRYFVPLSNPEDMKYVSGEFIPSFYLSRKEHQDYQKNWHRKIGMEIPCPPMITFSLLLQISDIMEPLSENH